MPIRPIRLFGDPVLRTPAVPVVDFDKELRTLVADLTDTMLEAPGGGLAAPQLGVGLRVFTWNVDGEVGHLVNPQPQNAIEVMNLFASMAGRHGDVLAAQMGMIAGEEIAVDENAVRAAFGMTEEDSNPLTHEELRRRRDMIRGRMGKR